MRAVASGVSRGTEALVFDGRVPQSQYAAMRAPFQEGDFPGPVKYGYLNVGVVEAGPGGPARPHGVLPAPAPDALRGAGRRGARRPRTRSRRSARCWPAPSRPQSTRCGTPRRSSATGSRSSARAWSAAASPGCSPRIPGVSGHPRRRRPLSGRRRRGARGGASPCPTTPKPAGTSSCTPAPRLRDCSGRWTCSSRRARWSTSAGTATPRCSSRWAAGSTPTGSRSGRARSARWPRPAAVVVRRPSGWRSPSTCSRDPAFDVLLTGTSRFEELPDVMPQLASGKLARSAVTYDHATTRGA